ncbi:MAG: SIMPL domain-containing protein, partial [Gammaproteobacteria bacterium]|nr:SIMPL domain-containing protein [Gammaproteobacteria bacterium]
MAIYKHLFVSLSVIIILGACMPSQAHTDANDNHADVMPRTLNVNGKAEVKAEPDRAIIPMSVEARAKDLNRARQDVDTAVKNILRMAEDLGIEKKHLQSAQLITRPEYNWNNQRKRELIGYYVSRQMEIDLHNLEDL